MRKSCAEVIHPVAQVCSKESRWNILSPCLIQLLQDQSRWVKTAALRVLGYFISTFLHSTSNPSDQTNEDLPSKPSIDDQQENKDKNEVNLSEYNDFFFWKDSIYLNVNIDEDETLTKLVEEQSENGRNRIEENFYEKSLKYPLDDIHVKRTLQIIRRFFSRSIVDFCFSREFCRLNYLIIIEI